MFSRKPVRFVVAGLAAAAVAAGAYGIVSATSSSSPATASAATAPQRDFGAWAAADPTRGRDQRRADRSGR